MFHFKVKYDSLNLSTLDQSMAYFVTECSASEECCPKYSVHSKEINLLARWHRGNLRDLSR